MRRTRGILLFAICIVMALTLSSCDVIDGVLDGLGITDPKDPCDGGHTYSTEWAHDAEKHWHPATCEHINERDSEAEHSYVDGICICGAEEPVIPHEHTYSAEWSKDADKHWHAATCEHTNERGSEAEHSYVDGVCICGAEEPVIPHEHTYSLEWSKDADKHWHAATCEHTDERGSEAEHSYVDGVCICGAEEPHEHSYSDVWSKDEAGHWHEASCGHDIPKRDEAAHDYNADYVCTTCGYKHEHTYAEAWLKDAEKHWHASSCGHAGFISGEAAHTYTNGVCICGAEEPVIPHEHTYSDVWSKDEAGHWHEASCGHDIPKRDEAAHDYNSDYVCTTCGYEHEHTYAETWSFDDAAHWHAATCGHDVRGDESEHFIGGDYACVANCGYAIEVPHEHIFSTKWSKNETHHWHAAICEHTDVVEDEEPHTIDGGVCTECGYAKPIVITADDIAQGGWAYGTQKSNSKRIRVDYLIPIKSGTVIRYDMNGLELYLDLADGVGASTGDRVGWLTGAGEYLVQRDAYLGITIAAAGKNTAIAPSAYNCEITVIPGTGEVEKKLEKVNVYKFGGEGNDWCFVYLPAGYDPNRATPYPFVIANHGNGWTMDGSRKKANWTNITMYMSAAEIAKQSASSQSRYIATEDESLWYSNPTIEALLAAGYIVCGAQNYGDNLYGNDDCTNAVVDFYNHMISRYNVETSCHMIGASNGAMTTLNAAAKLGDKVRSVVIQYPLASIISQYMAGNHRDNIEAAYGLDTSKTYTRAELEALIGNYDPLVYNVVNGVKQGYFPSVKIYYSMTDTTTPATANALPLVELLENSGKEVVGVRVDADGSNRQHGDSAHFDPEGYLEWFDAH